MQKFAYKHTQPQQRMTVRSKCSRLITQVSKTRLTTLSWRMWISPKNQETIPRSRPVDSNSWGCWEMENFLHLWPDLESNSVITLGPQLSWEMPQVVFKILVLFFFRTPTARMMNAKLLFMFSFHIYTCMSIQTHTHVYKYIYIYIAIQDPCDFFLFIVF